MNIFKCFTLLALANAVVAACAQDKPIAVKPDLLLPDSPFQPDLTQGYVLIEGDIQIRLEDYAAVLSGIHTMATFGAATFWPANVVPYDFVTAGGGAVSAERQTAAINAMAAIAARAGVAFRAATGGDANRIRFQNSTFNNSTVGMQGGAQIINIRNWGNQIVICHEIYHSLGFWHEQSRPDRGTFITVNVGNICGTASTGPCAPATCQGCADAAGNFISCAFNFNIQPGVSTYGPYDFDSFMHYPRAAFSCNGGDTITVNAPWAAQWQNAIGQLDHFSYFDGITCRALYPFPNDRWLDRTHTGPVNGTFQQPFNNPSLADALSGVPSGGTLLVKYGNTYSGVGTHSKHVTILAPNGPVVLGN